MKNERFLRLACAIGLAAAPAILASPRASAAQERTLDARAQAIRLRDAGDFKAAIAVLRAHLATHPGDGDALRLLAQLLYWTKDFAGARATSEQALTIHPEDTELRLQYAQMLIETWSGHRAREVLAPVISSATGGRADAILGTLDYWEGDLNGADKHFRSAIAAGNADPAVRRMHADIAVLTAPWIRIAPSYEHDDQPIDRKGAHAEIGWFPIPSTSLSLSGDGMQLDAADTVSRTVSQAELGMRHYAAAAHADIQLGIGGVKRSFGAGSDMIGDIGVAVHLPQHFVLGVNASRSAYLATEASLSQAVMTNKAMAYLRFQHPAGWLGETAYRLERFPDSNNLTSAYAWLLAPLVHSSQLNLGLGYAGSLQNSSESRFALAHPTQPFPPGDPRFDLEGRYQPYYTPIDIQSHSVIGAVSAHPSPATTFNAGGSYAFYATESAPVFMPVSTTAPAAVSVQRLSFTRHFNPWTAHASFTANATADVAFTANAEVFGTAFYMATSASVGLTYRLASRAIRRAGGY